MVCVLSKWFSKRLTRKKITSGITIRFTNPNQSMKSKTKFCSFFILTAAAAILIVSPAPAQQITGTPGAPSATVTIDGKQIPAPPMPFGGVIKESALDSKPWWPPRIVPPKGAPNILLIMTDDQGYGISSAFGGVIPTPALDRIAKAGLRYIQFHTTALCSPTRAALITGRNHHSVASGVITEMATGYPGYNSLVPRSAGSVAEVLRENGYNTSWFGKMHNVPDWMSSRAGPFDLWPSGLGFEYFYGFIGGDTSQWAPAIFENIKPIEPPHDDKNYFFDKDMANKAIERIRLLHSIAP